MAEPGRRAPRTGRITRTAVAAVATARVSAAVLRRRWGAKASTESAAKHEAEIGRILFAAMSQLRGIALKAAQVLSLDASFLPAGIKAELARACHQAPPLNRALVGRVFRHSFGCEPQALFKTFDHNAFAAASLGQVHRATLADGTPVAVKVQYPGIGATITTDMRLLRTALTTIGRGVVQLPDNAIVERLLAEIERQFHEELDYEREARSQQWFKLHARHDDIVIPAIVEAHTRPTVLTQQLLPGVHLNEWLSTAPAQSLLDRQGQAIFDWFMRCAFDLGCIHADLHPGNFLFMPDGRVGVLDFGCTRELAASFSQGTARAWLAYLQDDDPAPKLLATYRAMGIVGAAMTLEVFAAEVLPGLRPLLGWATQALAHDRFDFSTKTPPLAPQRRVQESLAKHMAGVPPDMLSFDRAWLGLMHLLRCLGATVNTAASRELLQRAKGVST